MQESKDIPAVKDMLKEAKEVLGYDLLKLCMEGPKEKLDDTTYSQPALFVAGLAAVERLRQDDPAAVNKASAAAGLSLGEYTALVFAGALSFKDGLKVGTSTTDDT
jgi:[acyl-carrier-protein] S-malonyltransferase